MGLNSFYLPGPFLHFLGPWSNFYRLLLFPKVATIALSKTGLILVPAEANSETRIHVQVVYLGGEGNM